MPPRWKKNHNMKSWTIIKILILVNCLRFASTQSCPGGQRTRREFRDMTVQEWAEFRTGILRLQQDGTWARLANQHGQFLRTAHDGGQFLPWHREYLLRVENELIRVNPNIRGLPYWNSAADSNAPHRSPLWTQNYLGGSTVSNNRPTCIPNGPFASFRRPDGRCITRGFSVAEGFTTNENGRVNMRLNSWQELMGFVDRYPTFGEFAYFLENFAHNYPHLWVGGYLGTMSLISDSAFDVAFILHHAFFDYIYHIWQQRHGFDTYQGIYTSTTGARTTLRSSDIINPFGRNVGSVSRISNLCYAYQPHSGRLGPAEPGTPPPAPPPPPSTTSRGPSPPTSSPRPPVNPPVNPPVTPPPRPPVSPPPQPPVSPPPQPPVQPQDLYQRFLEWFRRWQMGDQTPFSPWSSRSLQSEQSPQSGTFRQTSISAQNTTTTLPPGFVPPYVTLQPDENAQLAPIPEWYIQASNKSVQGVRQAEQIVRQALEDVRRRNRRGEFFNLPLGTQSLEIVKLVDLNQGTSGAAAVTSGSMIYTLLSIGVGWMILVVGI